MLYEGERNFIYLFSAALAVVLEQAALSYRAARHRHSQMYAQRLEERPAIFVRSEGEFHEEMPPNGHRALYDILLCIS